MGRRSLSAVPCAPRVGALPSGEFVDRSLLSVIIPVKDEENTLVELLTLVEDAVVPGMEKEIVVVDDGSTDRTAELLEVYRNRPEYVVVRHERNRGKGAAIRTGLEHVSGSIVLIQDADHEYDPSQYADLVAPIRAGASRVVYGSRFLGSIKGMALPNLVANKVLSLLASMIGPARITDEATCFKVFDAALVRSLPLECEGFEFCPEVTGLLQAMREPIVEVPIRYEGRTHEAGKKVRARDGFIAVRWMLRSRFARREELRSVPAAV